MAVHYSARMRHYLVKLVEILLLEQKHHVIHQDESVAGTNIDGFFKGHLSVVNIGGALQGERKITKCLFIVWFYF